MAKPKFDAKKFDPQFQAQILELANSEKISKEVLKSLSRSVLEAHHITQDVAYINSTIGVLSPVNRKVAILFFTEYSGFRCEAGVFTKKDKKEYEKCAIASDEFLADPNNNIWSWAEREVEVEKKEFDLLKVTKTVESLFKKADKAGFAQADVLQAMISGGLDVNALMVLMTAKAAEGNPAEPMRYGTKANEERALADGTGGA